MTEEEIKKYVNKCVRLDLHYGYIDVYIFEIIEDICISYPTRIPIINIIGVTELSPTETILFKVRNNL